MQSFLTLDEARRRRSLSKIDVLYEHEIDALTDGVA